MPDVIEKYVCRVTFEKNLVGVLPRWASSPMFMDSQKRINPIIMDIHNWIMDIHNSILDIHNWIMDIHNSILDIHNSS